MPPMSDAASHVHHSIDYIEITVSDVAAAKRFYTAAFGWAFNDYGPDYAGIKGEGREQGGLRKGAPATNAALSISISPSARSFSTSTGASPASSSPSGSPPIG